MYTKFLGISLFAIYTHSTQNQKWVKSDYWTICQIKGSKPYSKTIHEPLLSPLMTLDPYFKTAYFLILKSLTYHSETHFLTNKENTCLFISSRENWICTRLLVLESDVNCLTKCRITRYSLELLSKDKYYFILESLLTQKYLK